MVSGSDLPFFCQPIETLIIFTSPISRGFPSWIFISQLKPASPRSVRGNGGALGWRDVKVPGIRRFDDGNEEEKVTTGGRHRGKISTFFSKVGQEIHDLPSGNLLHSCGKSSFFMG